MPRGSKRDFNSFSEQSGTMALPLPGQRAVLQRPIPTHETQELYNRMRREEERLTEESLEHVDDGATGYLQLPSPSQATVSSPSPSYASTTHSISKGVHELAVAGDQLQPKKLKSGRHGPLQKQTKARAALMRKLGVCDECRERRVKCNHFDFCLFEAAYQEEKRAAAQGADPGHPTSSTMPYQPSLGEPIDLLGVGVGQNITGGLLTAGRDVRDDTHADFDPLLDQSQQQHPSVPQRLASVLGWFGGSPLVFPNLSTQHHAAAPAFQSTLAAHYQAATGMARSASATQYQTSSTTPRRSSAMHNQAATTMGRSTSASAHYQGSDLTARTASTARYREAAPTAQAPLPDFTPIGRLSCQGQWHCLWNTNECTSPAPINGLPSCIERCSTLEELKAHYAASHAPVRHDWPMWHCTNCGFEDLSSPVGPCSQCPRPGTYAWQRWQWAILGIPAPPTYNRPALSRTAGQGESPSNRSSWTDYSTQFSGPAAGGQTSPYTPSYGGYGYGSGGSGYAFRVAHAASQPAREPKACGQERPLVDQQKPFSAAFCSSESYPAWYPSRCLVQGGGSAKFSLRRHARPAAALLAVVLLALVEGWLSTGPFGGDLKQAFSSGIVSPNRMLSAARARVLDLSIVCIGAGLAATWLLRLRQRRGTQPPERCDRGDDFSVRPVDADGPVVMTAA